MMRWFLLSMLESLVIRGAQISVRSMAMSPVLRVVVIFDCRGGKGRLGDRHRGRKEGGRRKEVRVFGLHLHNRYSELRVPSSIRGSSIPG